METYSYNKITAFFQLLFISLFITACDEKLVIPKKLEENERLLTGQWQYQFIIMDGDTIKHLFRNGEPTVDAELFTPIGLRYLDYRADHSYELGAINEDGFGLGEGESYQPNFGYWDIEMTGGSLVLVHNKIMLYETKYDIIELTDAIMIRKLIGDRVTYLVKDVKDFSLNDTLVVSSWIEVFKPLTP